MPSRECEPTSLLKPGSCNPSTSHTKRLIESLSSILDNLKYCRATKPDFQPCLIPVKRARKSTSSTSSSSSSDSKTRREFEYRILFEQSRLSTSSEECTPDLQHFVDELGSENTDARLQAADKVRKLAKLSTRASTALVKNGAIPPLVSMLEDHSKSLRNTALLAILNLSAASNINKAAIVAAGAIPKLVKLCNEEPAVREAVSAILLSLSTLDVNKPVIGHVGAIRALTTLLSHPESSLRTKKDALRSLCNLCMFRENVRFVLATDVIDSLLDMLSLPDLVEPCIELIGTLLSTEAGYKAVLGKPRVILSLVDVIAWLDEPHVQERAMKVLMTMVYMSPEMRNILSRSRGLTTLTELSEFGNGVTQKMAVWVLDCINRDQECNYLHYGEDIPQPGRFVHKVLQQRNVGSNLDISDHFISITL